MYIYICVCAMCKGVSADGLGWMFSGGGFPRKFALQIPRGWRSSRNIEMKRVIYNISLYCIRIDKWIELVEEKDEPFSCASVPPLGGHFWRGDSLSFIKDFRLEKNIIEIKQLSFFFFVINPQWLFYLLHGMNHREEFWPVMPQKYECFMDLDNFF